MEQLLKIPVSPGWKIPSLKCPSIHLLSNGRLFAPRHLILSQLVQNLFHLTYSQFIISNTFLFLSPFFPSLWCSAKFIMVLVFQAVLKTQKDLKVPFLLNAQTSTFPKITAGPKCTRED